MARTRTTTAAAAKPSTAKSTTTSATTRRAPARRRPAPTTRFGVDIGGTGIKGAPVDLATGELTAERHRILTPQPATPEAVTAVVAEVIDHFGWKGPVGCTFPAVVKHGVTLSAANLDDAWIGLDADALLTDRLGMDVHVLNDADAAGVAEMAFGVGKGQPGVVVMVTLGTGIGSALFLDGKLVPNTEFGHLELDGHDAETRASERARIEGELSWKKYAKRLDAYLDHLEMLLTPDLIVLGGGGAKKADKFLPLLSSKARVVPALLGNDAGIVGAAMAAG